MKIRVGFDLSTLAYVGGVATYTKELAIRLDKITELEMRFLYMSLRQKLPIEVKSVKKLPIPAKLYEPLLNNWRVDIEKLIGDVDIFHSSDWVQPKTKARKVTTIHDVVPFKYPEWSVPKIVAVHKKRLELIEKDIDKVICVSETTREDLLQISKIDPNRVVVIYEGVDDRFRVLDEKNKVLFRERMNLPKDFLLAIGGVGKRRNIDRVREAAKILDIPVVVTGVDIRPTDVEMPLLYNSAKALVYPSLYEGFGLPIIEAFKCGLPVITSDLGAMKEIAGGAALLIDPNSVDSISQGIEKINDKTVSKKYIEKGLIRAKHFSWDKCANETFDVYRGLI
jgi:glycosyltransferase involved in cell wall biosynthesis